MNTEQTSENIFACRKKHHHKKSSSSSTGTETDFDTNPFKVISEADKYKHNLPTKMANYPNKQIDSYVKDADIKQQILLTNPLTENLNKAKKINEFVKDILKENYKHKDVDQNATFERIQSKNINVMRPLSKLWLLIQNPLLLQEEAVPIELNKVKEYVEQSILLLHQAKHAMTYHRRCNILSVLNCAPQ